MNALEKSYCDRLCCGPRLSREEEKRLAIRWREHGDVEAAHELVTSNLKFVVKVANDYRGYGAEMFDLIQAGALGLMQAVKRFNPHRGCRLISYAVYWIRAEIHAFLMQTSHLVKLGATRAYRKLFFKLRSLKGKLSAQGIDNREKVIETIAVETEIGIKDVEEIDIRMGKNVVSLDAGTKKGGGALAELLPDHKPNPEEILTELEVEIDHAARLRAALASLTQREREIVEKRYLDEVSWQLKEIGKKMGVSKQRVAQIEKVALDKIRQKCKDAA